MKSKLACLLLILAFLGSAQGKDFTETKRVLFYSKAASWEQKFVHRDGDGTQFSVLETIVQKLGQENSIEFTFSKDGTIFTPDNIARFDAFFFFTSGDLTVQQRNGRGDNFPLMTLEGKKAFLDAIQNGKGFIGCNTAVYTFIEPLSPEEANHRTNVHRYTKMIGGGYMGHNEKQNGHFTYLDRTFPGMEKVPADYRPFDQWYAFKDFTPDMHVIMALDAPKLTGNLYGRPSYPIAWARMEGKGRVFYTTMGHAEEIWKDPVFRQMIIGGIHWATGIVDADLTPNLTEVTPQAHVIPDGAKKFIPSNPTQISERFPNFKVWLPDPKSK